MTARIAILTASALLWVGTALALDPAPKCQAGKNKEAGKYAMCRQKAEAKAITTGDPADCTKCNERFLGKMTRLEEQGAGNCPDGIADPNTLADFITWQSAVVAQALAGPGLHYCGDGVLDPNEDCELGTMNGGTCVGEGFGGGTIGCVPETCAYDTSGCINNVVLFNAGGGFAWGSLGDRGTTSALCASEAASQGLTCNSTLAMLAYSGGDDIVSMPANHGVPTNVAILAHGSGEKIADDWADFMDGTWDTCLASSCDPSGPTPAGLVSYVVTGANNDGTVSVGGNCSDWSSTSGGFYDSHATCYGYNDGMFCFAGEILGNDFFGGGCAWSGGGPELLCLCY